MSAATLVNEGADFRASVELVFRYSEAQRVTRSAPRWPVRSSAAAAVKPVRCAWWRQSGGRTPWRGTMTAPRAGPRGRIQVTGHRTLTALIA
jgi:hypothetical protein